MGRRPKLCPRLLALLCFQVIVLLMTATLLGFGGYGTHEIEVKFDPINLIPKNSYLRDWFNVNLLKNPLPEVCNLPSSVGLKLLVPLGPSGMTRAKEEFCVTWDHN